ncbi:MAG: maleylpyruvate isomerase N-terminal domain-containing protein [Planctomycetota bacterium]
MPTPHPWTTHERAHLDAIAARMQTVADRFTPDQWDRPIRQGWTTKQMLAHLAFWTETTQPVVRTMLRGGNELPADRWYGGDDLGLGPNDPWPDADTHNTREAAWAAHRTPQAVIDRWTHAHRQLNDLIASVTPQEATSEIGAYLTQSREHTQHHLTELEAID